MFLGRLYVPVLGKNLTSVTSDTKEEKLVAAAELVNVYKVIFHHTSFNLLDCTTPLYSKLFPDSKIACKMSTA